MVLKVAISLRHPPGSGVKAGSPTQVMIDCRREQSTRLPQCDSLTTSRTTMFSVLAEKPVDATYC